MVYLGLDVHGKQTSICALAQNGAMLFEKQVPGMWPAMLKEVRRIKKEHGDLAVVFEAGGGMGWLWDQLKEICGQVTVAEPGRVRAMALGRQKNDRGDARFLARLLQMDNVPEVYVPQAKVRLWRGLISQRRVALGKRTGEKCRIRAFLKEQGIQSGKGLWTRGGQKWLKELELEPLARVVLNLKIRDYEYACESLEELTRDLDKVSLEDERVKLLMTMPGVGVRTAEAVVAWVDEVKRFKRASSIGSYFGLVPAQQQSGRQNHLGRVTRQGPSVVRWLLVEAAWRAARKSAKVGRLYAKIMRGDRQRRKKAAVAVARYMAEVMVAMLRDGRAWVEAA